MFIGDFKLQFCVRSSRKIDEKVEYDNKPWLSDDRLETIDPLTTMKRYNFKKKLNSLGLEPLLDDYLSIVERNMGLGKDIVNDVITKVGVLEKMVVDVDHFKRVKALSDQGIDVGIFSTYSPGLCLLRSEVVVTEPGVVPEKPDRLLKGAGLFQQALLELKNLNFFFKKSKVNFNAKWDLGVNEKNLNILEKKISLIYNNKRNDYLDSLSFRLPNMIYYKLYREKSISIFHNKANTMGWRFKAFCDTLFLNSNTRYAKYYPIGTDIKSIGKFARDLEEDDTSIEKTFVPLREVWNLMRNSGSRPIYYLNKIPFKIDKPMGDLLKVLLDFEKQFRKFSMFPMYCALKYLTDCIGVDYMVFRDGLFIRLKRIYDDT